MRKLHLILALAITSFSCPVAQSLPKHKIAIFTPLYLDTVFDAGANYKPNKVFPKYLNAGVDFYQGAKMAIDSLQKRGFPLEVFVYDTKAREPLYQKMNSIELKDVELIIAQSNATETRLLAEAAQRKKIPFISATLPNDAGIGNNPFFVVLNPTLQTHIEGIYKFIQRYYSLENVVVFRKNGTQEDQIKNYFTGYAKSTSALPLNMKYVDLAPDFNSISIMSSLDSNKRTICICGSMDESFGMKLAQAFGALRKSYSVTIFGMPTWENLNLGRSELNDLEIIYTAPYYYNRATALESAVALDYNKLTNGRPNDLFFRGYEVTLRFIFLLLDAKKDIASSLSKPGNLIFTPFDIQPVFKDRKTMVLDYFENKHLYFMKALGGTKNVLY